MPTRAGRGSRISSGSAAIVSWRSRRSAGPVRRSTTAATRRPKGTPPTKNLSDHEPETTMRPVLLYDDTCGFCAESVQLVLKHDRRGTLQFASLYGSFGAAVLARHPHLAGVDSMV